MCAPHCRLASLVVLAMTTSLRLATSLHDQHTPGSTITTHRYWLVVTHEPTLAADNIGRHCRPLLSAVFWQPTSPCVPQAA